MIIKATKSENKVERDAPIGMGDMYGPIKPVTKAIGRIAATTVKVERIVGFPTSSIEVSAAWYLVCFFILKWRCIFSTIIIESSTTIPVTKTRANKVILFKV